MSVGVCPSGRREFVRPFVSSKSISGRQKYVRPVVGSIPIPVVGRMPIFGRRCLSVLSSVVCPYPVVGSMSVRSRVFPSGLEYVRLPVKQTTSNKIILSDPAKKCNFFSQNKKKNFECSEKNTQEYFVKFLQVYPLQNFFLAPLLIALPATISPLLFGGPSIFI